MIDSNLTHIRRKKAIKMASECFPMSSKGHYSYALRSSYQKSGTNSTLPIIVQEISEKINVKQLLSSSNLFTIADLGCSIGPNTFSVVQNVIEAVKLKYQTEEHLPSSEHLEFQVFFNDLAANDFNALFRSLPPQRPYYHAAGVPGSFHGRLFPKASLHFVYSSYALQWLSAVPREVADKTAPTWNKSRILYGYAELEAAYLAYYVKDLDLFLASRAEEVVSGGLVAFQVIGRPVGVDSSQCKITAVLHLLGSALMDMANLGAIDKTKVEAFNMPLYFASPKEVLAVIEKNRSFVVERTEELLRAETAADVEIQNRVKGTRSISQELLAETFGSEIMDELFDRFAKKVEESGIFGDESYAPYTDLFFLLRHGRNIFDSGDRFGRDTRED